MGVFGFKANFFQKEGVFTTSRNNSHRSFTPLFKMQRPGGNASVDTQTKVVRGGGDGNGKARYSFSVIVLAAFGGRSRRKRHPWAGQ